MLVKSTLCMRPGFLRWTGIISNDLHLSRCYSRLIGKSELRSHDTLRTPDPGGGSLLPAALFRHGFANDVFISYRHRDDKAEVGMRSVSRFEIALRRGS